MANGDSLDFITLYCLSKSLNISLVVSDDFRLRDSECLLATRSGPSVFHKINDETLIVLIIINP